MDEPADEVMWQGDYLVARRRGTWEYVARAEGLSAAVILAVVAGDVLLVEQHRAAVGGRCLELPAGLVGDEAAGESIVAAAIRELEEETGWRAERMVEQGRFHSSPGLASEQFTLLRAEGLAQVGAGGGVGIEDIAVHRVPLAEVPGFVEARRAAGVAIDVKLLLLLAGNIMGR